MGAVSAEFVLGTRHGRVGFVAPTDAAATRDGCSRGGGTEPAFIHRTIPQHERVRLADV